MKKIAPIIRFVVLLAVTAVAIGVMVQLSQGTLGGAGPSVDLQPVPKAAAPKLPVTIKELRPETIEIFDTFTGMIEPWERYALGFETGGRVITLGATVMQMVRGN